MQHEPNSYDRLEDLKPAPRKTNVIATVATIAVIVIGFGVIGWLLVRAM